VDEFWADARPAAVRVASAPSVMEALISKVKVGELTVWHTRQQLLQGI
jgi:hypothetical protein